ncbi:Fic/DOC family N-terminal domain-containing protein [Paramesorhizobium deserti]|uniref:Fic/DOC family N-terminal domain-containing protein n=1 Tax=Paramesorhizobium deserti TaxID=1494590 RepID=UPI00244EE818|nr:Fic/DOC family N-terminal domain-containing protein [Paramesorhizobium deserti]
MPNQAVLISSIPLLEAQASSEIENIVTTTNRLFRFANNSDGQADPATKEALRYRTALHRGFEMLKQRPLSTAIAVEACRTIKGVDLDIRDTPGTALMNDATGTVIYTPRKERTFCARSSQTGSAISTRPKKRIRWFVLP